MTRKRVCGLLASGPVLSLITLLAQRLADALLFEEGETNRVNGLCLTFMPKKRERER